MKPVIVPTTDVNSETAIVTAWHVANGSQVQSGDVVATVETSKSVIDVVVADSGYLMRSAAEGEEIVLDKPLAYVFPSLEELDEHAAQLAVAAADAASSNGVRATAPAIKRAAEVGVDLGALAAGGLITVKIVEAAADAAAPTRELPPPLTSPPGVERVVLIGAALGATQVIDILSGDASKQPVAIVDDDANRWAAEVAGVPVVGGRRELAQHFIDGRFDSVVIAVGTSVAARTRLREVCAGLGIPLTNAIHPTVHVASDVELGVGNVICAFCHFGVGTRVGDNNFLSAYNSFDHHNELGSDIATGPGCMTSGVVRIGDRARFGTGVFIQPHVDIGAGVQVASGAVIVNSVPAEHAVKRHVTTMVTMPIRRRREG